MLDHLPRIGLVPHPSPLTALPGLADRLGLASLTLKRDDLLPALGGGTKARKLDLSLASPPLADAPCWVSAGAIGSGHLVALTAAGQALDRPVHVHVFWEPVSVGVREALAYVASHAASVTAHRGRIGMGLMHPRLMLGRGLGALAPGGSSPAGIVGVARGALEIAHQIQANSLRPPDHVIVPLGSAGTAAGLRLGFALAGLRPTVHAVAVVEPIFAGRRRVDGLCAEALAWLRARGPIEVGPLPPLRIRRGYLGRGYGIPSAAGEAARARIAAFSDVPFESVYSAKALAALFADDTLAGHVLFWVTPRGRRPLPHAAGWMARLPAWLARRLTTRPEATGLTRRGAVGLGVSALVAGLVGARILGYPELPGWSGVHLAPWEAHVLRAAAQAFAPMMAPAVLDAVPAAVDRYLVGMPPAMVREIHLLLGAIEHGTLLQISRRFTRLSPADRQAWLARLPRFAKGREAWRGLRDLCMLGVYQQPATWPALGYGGPVVLDRLRADPYADLATARPPPGWRA